MNRQFFSVLPTFFILKFGEQKMLKFILFLMIFCYLTVFNVVVLNVCFGHEKPNFRCEKQLKYRHKHKDIDIQIAEETFIQNHASKRR